MALDLSILGEIMPKKWVYHFEEGNAKMRDLLGGKGAGLAEMTNLGLPVPPGFIITTEACLTYLSNNHVFPEGLWKQIQAGIHSNGAKLGRRFGAGKDPLLVSVRSGSKFSMPGMMDTILNLGLNASPGAAVGEVCFDADTAEAKFKDNAIAVILVRPETTPDDLHGMIAAQGILTQHGGATSHAAVVARQFGKPCVAGCEEIKIDLDRQQFTVDGRIIKAGDTISLDGTTGQVFDGKIAMIVPSFEEQHDLKTILQWADNLSRLKVWANADTPQQALLARHYGAQGIGLCRTEHMFMGERTAKFQEAILAAKERCQSILDDILLPLQRKDFYDIFEVMDGLPVIIRLLDPPLHEFLPSKEELLVEVTRLESRGDISDGYPQKKELLSIVTNMEEMNPMLGQRGCRLGLMRPELNQMQVQAIFEAACDATQNGIEVHPEIMIPLTSHFKELKMIQPVLEDIAAKVMQTKGVRVNYKFGTMIEIPRAALTADELAATAQFFSFGTNDLTQMTFGISRDDAERKFLVEYVNRGILGKNPFHHWISTASAR